MHAVDQILHRHINEQDMPSVQYYIFSMDQLIHHFSEGFADIKNKKPTHARITYHAFSVTKTFTALAVMQLVEKKMLQLEDAVKKYLPEFPYDPATNVKQLLTHSAGIPNPIPLKWIHPVEEHGAFNRDSFFNQVFAKNKQTQFKPNEKFAYSNLGYILLGQLIEKISGLSYEQYITDNIINKAGLGDKLGFTIGNISEHAKGYHKRFTFSNLLLGFLINKSKFMGKPEGKWIPFNHYYVNGVSYGGLIGTPDAFVKYLQALLKPDGLLISDDLKQLLFTENYSRNGNATGMCLSWYCGQLKGEKFYCHAGGGGGYYCELRLYPGAGIGSVVMLNRTGMTDVRFLDKLDTYFIDQKKTGSG